mmetsp:Transcript_27971/g.80283  ORF Transcript_27971/g.80283 Transcript_27971/m.80283 type:complete len:213 (+) Transcript_27971:382-1020(+)
MPILIEGAEGLRGVDQHVDEVAADEDLQQVAGVAALARAPAELRHVQPMPFRERDDVSSQFFDRSLRNIARLQQVLQHASERHVLLAIACEKDDRRRRLWAQCHERAHRGNSDSPVLRVMVLVAFVVHLVVALHQRPGVRKARKFVNEDPGQRRVRRSEAEDRSRDGSLHLVDEGCKRVRVVEHGPLATKSHFVVSELAEASLGVRVLIQNR